MRLYRRGGGWEFALELLCRLRGEKLEVGDFNDDSPR
jgi:hypothetical protein